MYRVLRGFMLLAAVVSVLAGCVIAANSRGDALPPKEPDALRVATYNVHYILLNAPSGRWSVADWELRKGPLDATLKALGADVVAFQEMESFSGGSVSPSNLALDWVLANNAEYAAAAVGDPRTFPSTQPILYRKDRLDLAREGWFFFSETPDEIYSRTFNGSYPAFASWARFLHRDSGVPFTVVNVHFDYGSRTNRLRSAELVAERISAFADAGETVILAGDLNAWNGSRVHRIIESAGITFAEVRGSTFHFDRGVNLFGAIDHLGWSAGARLVGDPVVVREKFGAKWGSDHYPVVADFHLREDAEADRRQSSTQMPSHMICAGSAR